MRSCVSVASRALAIASLIGLATAAAAQPSDVAGPSSPAAWRASRFDLSQLAPDAVSARRDASSGADLELGPNLVGSLEAADIQRGGAAAIDTTTPLFQRQAELSGRLGVLVDGRSLLFGRVGYAEFDLAQAFPRFGSRGFSTNGVLIGAGAETRLSPALSLTTEFRSVDYSPALSNRQMLGGLSLRY